MSGCSIKLEVGKMYVARDGKIYGPLVLSALNHYPFLDNRSNKTWAADGVYERGRIDELDLVREHVEQPAVADPVNNPSHYASGAVEGRKDDLGKLPLGLIPREALLAEAAVLEFGARKYEAHNWRKGMAWSRLGDAAMRHLLAWLDGEDNDPETGLPHLAHLRCCAGFLLNYAERGLGQDDRHTASNADA